MNKLNQELNDLQKQHKIDLQLDINQIAKIGSWEYDLEKNAISWSEITRKIHEVEVSFEPNIETGINFYKEGESREIIIECLEKAMNEGTPWDVELQLVTAKGREIWVRSIGKADFLKNKCIRLFGVFQDIDERVRADKEHAKTLERLRLATDAAKIGIWDYDVVNNKLIWDKQMLELYGIKKDDFQGNYTAWSARIHPDDQERNNKEIAMALADEKPFDTEFRVLNSDNTIRYIRAIASVKRNAGGEAIRMTGVNWDVTNRRTNENQLRESEERFRQLFENAPIGIGLVDTNGQWIQINESFEKILGYSIEELKKRNFLSLTHADDLEKSRHFAKEIREKRIAKYQLEKRYFHKNGEIKWVIIAVSTVNDKANNTKHYIVQMTDISEKKKAEQLATKERAFLQTLIDNLPVNVYVKDLESRKTLINRKELEHMGLSDINTVLGKNDHDLYPKWSADISRKEDLEVFETGEGFIDMETLNEKKNGEKNWFLTSKIPLKDEAGKVTGLLGISYNITKHKQAEEKMRQFSILESKSKEMEQFAFVASHDLREPLLTIRGYTELIQEDFADDLDKDGLQILANIQEAVNRMDSLIHGLLDYSRLSRVKEIEQVNLAKVLQDVQADLTAAIQKNLATISIGKLPVIKAYPLEIKLLFQNLISNAIKFRRKDRTPEIHVGSRKINGGWEFFIKDNGIGIEKRNKEKIFNIFSRLHSKDQYPGTGIGLANCKKIVELHNGKIWVTSTPNVGSTFYFTILTEI